MLSGDSPVTRPGHTVQVVGSASRPRDPSETPPAVWRSPAWLCASSPTRRDGAPLHCGTVTHWPAGREGIAIMIRRRHGSSPPRQFPPRTHWSWRPGNSIPRYRVVTFIQVDSLTDSWKSSLAWPPNPISAAPQQAQAQAPRPRPSIPPTLRHSEVSLLHPGRRRGTVRAESDSDLET
jgi:hypothetical protein